MLCYIKKSKRKNKKREGKMELLNGVRRGVILG